MTPKEQIEQYLAEKPENRDYTTGYNLFCKYSKQFSVQNHLARKEDRSRLFYKLEQLLEQNDIKESKTFAIPIIQKAQNKTEVVEAEVRLGAASKGKINPDNLPAELKPLYDQVSEAYKKQRSFHEKMKIAKSDKARAGFRKEIVKLDNIIRSGWQILDDYALTGELPKAEEKSEISAKDVTAARTFLSRGLKTLETIAVDKKPDLVEKLKLRYDILVAAKSEFEPNTIEILTKHGIIESGKASN